MQIKFLLSSTLRKCFVGFSFAGERQQIEKRDAYWHPFSIGECDLSPFRRL